MRVHVRVPQAWPNGPMAARARAHIRKGVVVQLLAESAAREPNEPSHVELRRAAFGALPRGAHGLLERTRRGHARRVHRLKAVGVGRYGE